MNLGDFVRQAVRAAPEKPFLRFDEQTISYEEFDAASNRAAHVLHSLGVRHGDRVALVLPNMPLFLILWFGAAKLGVIMTSWNPEYKTRELTPLLAHADPHIVVTTPALVSTVQESGDTAGTTFQLLHTGETAIDRVEGVDALLREAPAEPPGGDVRADDICTLIYTSGTTGRPKGVLHTHATYVCTGEAFPYWLGLTQADRLFTCLPLFHINAQAYSTMGSVALGTTLILAERFSAHSFLRQLAESGATTFNFIGAMVLILRKQPPSESDRAHCVRITYGVPALAPEVRDEIEERFGFRILAGYGLTEATFGTMESLDESRRPLSIGKPRQHPAADFRNEVRIIDPAGHELPAGQVGEIVLCNPAIMRAYFRDPELTRQALAGGWLHTEDVGYGDTDGFFYFVARGREVIRRRGENISALEIEMVANEHPQVAECAAVGVPSELGDEDVKLIVVRRPDAHVTPAELLTWCEGRLARFKVPRYVEFRAALPKTATGRVLKHQLTAEAHATGADVYDRERVDEA